MQNQFADSIISIPDADQNLKKKSYQHYYKISTKAPINIEMNRNSERT
jgi:hypothetical protein